MLVGAMFDLPYLILANVDDPAHFLRYKAQHNSCLAGITFWPPIPFSKHSTKRT